MRGARSIGLLITTVVAGSAAAQPGAEPVPANDDKTAAPDRSAPAAEGATPGAPAAWGEPAGQPGPPEQEDLLAHIKDEPPAAAGTKDETATFGSQLQLFGLEATWSGYGDFTFSMIPKDRKSATFDASHFNPIMSLRMTERLTGELELEYEHAGSAILVEYALLDWSPTGSRALLIRGGKFLAPIGRFNEQLHPSFRWNQVSRPLMMRDVIPSVWGEVGVQVRGTIGDTTVLDYAAYVSNGLGGKALDAMSAEPVRGLRNNVQDNNFDKAVGGRAVVTRRESSRRSVSIGVSGYTGKIDAAGAERLTIVDADAQVLLGALTLNAEVAQSYLGRKDHYLDGLQRGAYVQAAYALGKLTLAGRYDYARTGPLTGPRVSHQQAVGTLRYSPAASWSARLELAVPFAPSGAADETQILSMVSFVF